MKLSLCIPAYNEEKNIHYPLDSAYDLVDEVIVIDAGSTDRTAEIARSYGAKVKVFKTDNPRNFLINKQRAIEKASGDWILQLDADEALSEELKKEIVTLLHGAIAKKNNRSMKQSNNEIIGYYIPRKNWFLSRFLMKGGVYPDYVLRLYKRENARFDLKNLHENVRIVNPKKQGQRNKQTLNLKSPKTNSLDTGELEIGYLQNPILHYADPNFSRYLLRWDRYTTFDAEELNKSSKRPVSTIKCLVMGIDYFLIKPTVWFFKTYFRHWGFLDGFPGFVFSLFSAIRFWVIYIKWRVLIKSHFDREKTDLKN